MQESGEKLTTSKVLCTHGQCKDLLLFPLRIKLHILVFYRGILKGEAFHTFVYAFLLQHNDICALPLSNRLWQMTSEWYLSLSGTHTPRNNPNVSLGLCHVLEVIITRPYPVNSVTVAAKMTRLVFTSSSIEKPALGSLLRISTIFKAVSKSIRSAIISYQDSSCPTRSSASFESLS